LTVSSHSAEKGRVTVKKPPINIAPTLVAIGDKHMVIKDNDQYIRVDLEAFYRTVPMSLLKTLYDGYWYDLEPQKGIRERIAESQG
jgi:hypothetical protein